MYANRCADKPNVGSTSLLLGKKRLLGSLMLHLLYKDRFTRLFFFFFPGGALLRVYSVEAWMACECFILLSSGTAKKDRKQGPFECRSDARNSSAVVNESPGNCL